MRITQHSFVYIGSYGIYGFSQSQMCICDFGHVRTGIGAEMWLCRTLIWMFSVSGFICCVGVLCVCWFHNPFPPEVNLLFRWALLAAEKINENGRLRNMYDAYVGWDYQRADDNILLATHLKRVRGFEGFLNGTESSMK